MGSISEIEADALMAQEKAVKGGTWDARANHAGHQIWVAQVFDMEDISIPGLTVELEVKAAAPVDTCLYQFTLRQRVGMHRLRAYQLEVVHKGKRSHNGPYGPLYGPHEHIGTGETSVYAVAAPELRCDNWQEALSFFAERAGIRFDSPVNLPC